MIRSSGPLVMDSLQGLTAKQCEVLDLLIEHKTSKEISRMLGISPHTVDQRIMLARAKLHVSTRSEVAQAYRRMLGDAGQAYGSDVYERSIYGLSDVAVVGESGHARRQEAHEPVPSSDRFVTAEPAHIAPPLVAGLAVAGLAPNDPSRSYYHVLPEAFDGRVGTLLRLGAIAMITVFLTLMILGGLAIYSELSHMLDG